MLAITVLSITMNIALIVLVRHLSISPSFGIPVQAVGRINIFMAIVARFWVYIDIDYLGKINDIFTTETKPGMIRWNEVMTDILRKVRSDEKFLVYGGDEFAFGLRLWSFLTLWYNLWHPRHKRTRTDPHAFCERLQGLLRDYPYTEHEREGMRATFGVPYPTLTAAWCLSQGRNTHHAAFMAAHTAVVHAKPKDAVGQRGSIIATTLEL